MIAVMIGRVIIVVLTIQLGILYNYVDTLDVTLDTAKLDTYEPVYPGDWCANETIKTRYEESGNSKERQECCSQREECGSGMDHKPSKHGDHRDDPYTAADCTCDLYFFSCIKRISKTEDEITDRIGLGYTLTLRPICF